MKPIPPSNTLRPSACPGLLRIVQALDGGICRIKLAGGSIRAEQAFAVADAAQAHAGGVIEATNRANLQIRGIGAEQDGLIAALLAADLGPRSAAGDDVRNLMLSPSAGIDREMLFDTRPLADEILATLETHPRFHELSAKFAVQLDGGEGLAMLEHHHDLWLSAFDANGETLLAFGLAGCPAQDAPLAAVPLAQGHALVVAVLELFLELARPDQTRMRHLLVETAVDNFLGRLNLPLQPVDGFSRHSNPAPLHLGSYPQRKKTRSTSPPSHPWAAWIRRCSGAPRNWPLTMATPPCVSRHGRACCCPISVTRRLSPNASNSLAFCVRWTNPSHG